MPLYDTYKRPLIDDGYRDIAEIGLQAGEHLAAVGTEVDEVAFDSGVTHGAEGIAVVQHLVLVFSLGLSRLVVDDPHAVGGVDNPVRTDYLVVPGYIAFVFGRELRVEEARHFGLCHHVVEGLAEVGGGFVVGTSAVGVGVEGIVEVVGAVDERQHLVHLVAAPDGCFVQLAEYLSRLLCNGDA